MNRRKMLKTTTFGLISGAGLLISACSKKESAKETADANDSAAAETAESLDFVSESNSVAQSLGYKEDAGSVDPAVRADKGDTKGADQFCTNCRFYSAEEGSENGKCTLFPGKYVKGQAWCKSWSLKQS